MQGFRRIQRKDLFRTPRFLRRFRRNTLATLSHGNSVELLPDGFIFFPALLQGLAAARSHIFTEFYIIHNDRTGAMFADALLAAATRGVQVRLCYDYLGCIDTPASYFRRLEDGGVQCLPFNRPSFKKGLRWFDRRNHRKFAIIDGTLAFLGGMNIGDEYSGCDSSTSHWRDVGVRLSGPVVDDLQQLFLETWHQEGGTSQPLPDGTHAVTAEHGDADIMVVSGGPHHNRSRIAGSFQMALAGASSSVKIITPYFVPGPRLVRALLRTARRGVTVQLLLPSISDVPLIKLASRAYLAPLIKGGIEVYERQGAILHAKMMLIDSSWATVGSANLDLRSFHRNYEINVAIDCPEFGERLDAMFSDDLSKSLRFTLNDLQAQTWFERILERLCDPIRRFL
jgi:cardiolipin synthase A/B